MTTLAQYRVQVAAKMGLNNETGSADQSLMLAWANQAYGEVLAAGRTNVASATMTLTSGSADYSLPTQILAINEVYLTDASDSLARRLTRVSAQEILDMRIGAQDLSSPPVRYYALNGASLLMVYPTPDAADVVTVYYVPRPTPLSGDSDEPGDIPAEWGKVIEYFMLWQAGQYVNDKFSANGETHRQMYEAELGKLRNAALHRGGRRLSPAVVGRRPVRVSSPGQDDGR